MTIKEKILTFLDSRGIKKADFFESIGVAPSNFKGTAKYSELGGDKIVKILTAFPELSAEWLLRGEGPMLRDKKNCFPQELVETDPQKGINYIPPGTPLEVKEKSKNGDRQLPQSTLKEFINTIREQAEEIGRLKALIDTLERGDAHQPVPVYVHSQKEETVET